MYNFILRSILKPIISFFFFLFIAEWVTDNCALFNEERDRIFALDNFSGCLESVSWCFWKDWICNKIEHCDVGMVFHSTLEPRCHLKTNKLLLSKSNHCPFRSYMNKKWQIWQELSLHNNKIQNNPNPMKCNTGTKSPQTEVDPTLLLLFFFRFFYISCFICCTLLPSHQMAANANTRWGPM